MHMGHSMEAIRSRRSESGSRSESGHAPLPKEIAPKEIASKDISPKEVLTVRRSSGAVTAGAAVRSSTTKSRSHLGRNLREIVADGVREAIMSGEYPPGSALGEVDLAERFGVSRGPVREALIQLEREYLVRSYPNRGVFVSALTESEFEERLQLRVTLEPLALEAARHRATSRALQMIRDHFERLQQVAESGNISAYGACDYAFHVAVWDMAGRPLLKDMLMKITAPVFVYDSIVSDRYGQRPEELIADARAHQGMVDYLHGCTDLDAESCLRPVLLLAMRAERPSPLGDPLSVGNLRQAVGL